VNQQGFILYMLCFFLLLSYICEICVSRELWSFPAQHLPK